VGRPENAVDDGTAEILVGEVVVEVPAEEAE